MPVPPSYTAPAKSVVRMFACWHRVARSAPLWTTLHPAPSAAARCSRWNQTVLFVCERPPPVYLQRVRWRMPLPSSCHSSATPGDPVTRRPSLHRDSPLSSLFSSCDAPCVHQPVVGLASASLCPPWKHPHAAAARRGCETSALFRPTLVPPFVIVRLGLRLRFLARKTPPCRGFPIRMRKVCDAHPHNWAKLTLPH